MVDVFFNLISVKNLLGSWEKFSLGKSDKKDVLEFWRNLEENIFNIHFDLKNNNYGHGSYEKFIVCDPKKRIIHKAAVRDRIVHQAVSDYLLKVFDKRFIFDSFASRIGKGTHRAIGRLRLFCKILGRNGSTPCWILKCDIEKFFDNIDHKIIFSLIEKRIKDKKILNLIGEIINSFEVKKDKGLPLGNLTSQLFANIYLNELDFFIKNILRLENFIRFNDDFVVVHTDKDFLSSLIPVIQNFLKEKLSLSLPEEKIFLRKLDWGVDFVGYVVFPGKILCRTKTKKRIIRETIRGAKDFRHFKMSFGKFSKKSASYLGVLKHCSSFKLRQDILNLASNMLE